MSVMIEPGMNERGTTDPSAPENNIWYRQFYVWLIIFLPLCAVTASFATLYIAAKNAPELAVDDYGSIQAYTEQQVARDSRAAELSLNALLIVSASDESGTFPVQIDLQARNDFVWPDSLYVRVVHSTKSTLDAGAEFTGMQGRYTGAIALPNGAYDLHLEDIDRTWRLSNRVSGQPEQITLEAFRVANPDKNEP